MAEIQINAIAFEPGGVVISYIEVPTDVRVEGQLVLQHQISMSAEHPDYAEDIDSLHSRAVKALKNALEDFRASDPFTPGSDTDDDDERGMGE